MIDDKFDEMIRQMLNHFFSDAFQISPEGNGQIKFVASNRTNYDLHQDSEQDEKSPNIERIDLGDSLLIIVESPDVQGGSITKLIGRELILSLDSNEGKELRLEIPCDVDIDKSTMSVRNGVIELRLMKVNDTVQNNDSDVKILKKE